MPFGVSHSASFVEKEILKYKSGLEVIKSVVLDANDSGFNPVVATDRNVIPAGTILKKGTANTKQYVKYNGTGTIEGVLLHSVEILANTTGGVEPVPMIWFNAVFATPAIVDFTTYAANLVSGLTSCRFE